MSKVLFRGKVDESYKCVCLNVILPDVLIDLLLLFVIHEKEPPRGIIIMANSSTKDHDVPMSFVSGAGYHLEMYGLQKKTVDGREYYELEVYKRSRFTVQKSSSKTDLNFEFKFENGRSSNAPLSYVTEANFDIGVTHKPVSRYTIKCYDTYKMDKVHIITLRQPRNRLNFFMHTGKKLKYTIPFHLPAAAYCDFKFVIGYKLHGNEDIQVFTTELNSRLITFKTFFTITEYEKLLEKTKHFLTARKGNFRSIKYLYRNKSEMYFSSVMECHDGIMRPYKKDHNGDPFSVINGRIDGLFFSTAVEFHTGRPPPCSLFGPVRLYIEAVALFTPNCNLYFADFYCHYKVHYVTVILTPKQSPTDGFCKLRLLQLDIYNNPFIYLLNRGEDIRKVRVYQSIGFRVELFYTEPINIPLLLRNHQGYFEKVPIIGKGKSTPSGIPKNKNCTVCNI